MAKKKNQQKLSQAVRNVGPVMSKSEAKQVAKATGKSVEQVTAKATKVGVGLGSALVNQISKSPTAPAPLQNLTLNKGTAYYGSSTTTTPSSQTRSVNGGMSYTPASTTYNPIVLPRKTAPAGGGNNSNQPSGGNNNANDPYQDLRGQIDAAQQTINDLQSRPVDPYPQITTLLAEQQAAAAAQQEAMQAQAAQQQQFYEAQLAAANAQQQAMQTEASQRQQALEAQAAQQQQALQELMIQQQQAYDTQMAEARRQQEAMAAQAAEAQRQATAVANAYVPGLEPTAAAPVLGDARSMTRSSATNTLSNLSILTGLGISGGVTASSTASNPLSGLQIA